MPKIGIQVLIPLVAALAIASLTVIRLTLLDGADASSDSGKNEVDNAAAAVAPPGWVHYEDDVFQGWIHPDWHVGNIDLNPFLTDDALSDLAPLVRQSVAQHSDALKDTTIIWIKLDIDQGASGIQIHGCLAQNDIPAILTQEMIAETYRSLGMRATPAGVFMFGNANAPVVRIDQPPNDMLALQASLLSKNCYTTAELFAPKSDADSIRLFEMFVENLRFKD